MKQKEDWKRNWKGLWIPREVYLDENLSWIEKILFMEIDSLDSEKGCFASNEYFSKFLLVSKTRISIMISKLKTKEFIWQESFDGRERVLHSNMHYSVKGRLKENLKADFKKSLRSSIYNKKEYINPLTAGHTPSSSFLVEDGEQLVDPKNLSEFNQVISSFKEFSKRYWEVDPEINHGKDGKRVKEVLKRYKVEQVIDIIDWYLGESKKSEEHGCILSIALSEDTIMKFFAETSEKQKLKY